MNPTSVALCITDLDAGGAERQMAELAARLDRARFRPVVYCLGPRPERDDASCVPMLEQAGVECHCLAGRGARHFLGVTARLTERLKEQRPALLQSFLFHANLVGRIAARRAGVPHVVCGIRVAEREKAWHPWLDRLTQAMVDRYACVSQAVADFSRDKGHLPAGKLTVIPNGIDLSRFPASVRADLAPLGIPSGARVVACVGRLVKQKGQEWLIRSTRQWLAEVAGTHLLLVGDGPDRARLEACAARAGLADRIHFAGFRSDVPAILAASKVLVLPSAWEGMPNVVLEAMATGLPVVASEVEGVSELLGPLAGEQTVPFGDESALARRLTAILADAAHARALGVANRQRVEQCFSLERTCRAYEQLWDSLRADAPPSDRS
ncbi:MAG: glycosyltransferase [Patescibacteria group bacterium]|nr:glycosyltransferase [Patescibacteria group bacterium]